jgi:hypothetical protein
VLLKIESIFCRRRLKLQYFIHDSLHLPHHYFTMLYYNTLPVLAILILSISSATLAFVPPPQMMRNNVFVNVALPSKVNKSTVRTISMAAEDESSKSEVEVEVPDQKGATSNNNNNKSDRYDVSKLVGGLNDEDGAGGFNQFDPVLTTTGFLSRRFGIFGGLAIFAGLALVEGREIWKGFDDIAPLPGSGETITTESGLKITEILIGKAGSAPLPGYIIGLKAVVKIGNQVIYETAAGEKPVAFKYGQRPFQNVICEGVEEGIKGMRVGGKRVLQVPPNLAPPGVDLPPGVPLTFEIELTEVLSGYF